MILTLKKSFIFLVPLFFSFIVNQSQIVKNYIPQIIAVTSILILLLLIFYHRLYPSFIIFLISIIILSTGAINSPFFFLNYFLLFTLAFQNTPLINLEYSLFIILIYSYSLNSLTSIISLLSLLLITPLTWLISKQQEVKNNNEKILSQDETDFLLWISLRLKKSLREIIDLSSNHQAKKIAKNLLKDSEKLSRSIDQNSDED